MLSMSSHCPSFKSLANPCKLDEVIPSFSPSSDQLYIFFFISVQALKRRDRHASFAVVHPRSRSGACFVLPAPWRRRWTKRCARPKASRGGSKIRAKEQLKEEADQTIPNSRFPGMNRRFSGIMASTREQILARLRDSKPKLQAEFPLKRLALFGSHARGTQVTGASDVDILVEVDPSIGLRFVTLAERLEELLGERVDLVSRRAIKPSLWKRIEPELIDA